ncbi:MAG TPA: hypothetical protein VL283_00475 [Candidatus Baltobacteraceae bacterium]|nr:hypothetical protein [Candidatus Baltobacteraceae bacterium]
MGIFDWVLIGLFLYGFIGSCASLGATSSPPPAAPGADPEEGAP